MSILVINSGSTSIKYKLFAKDEAEIKQGEEVNIKNHDAAIKSILREIGSLNELEAVGHRVVHGGQKFIDSVIINDENIKELQALDYLAPLHNPHNLAGMQAAGSYLPGVPEIAVFDTSFFHELPQVAKTYALPAVIREKYGIFRYGFHGLSHQYLSLEAARVLNREVNKTSLISCHLGGGSSVVAIKNGRPIDTSMGYTPMEGLVMMSRAGDLDDGIIFELLRIMPGEINEQKVHELYDLLNSQSGIKGLTGYEDYQQFLRAVSLGEDEAKLAFEMVINRLVKYIAFFWVMLEGQVDAIVFSGEIGAGNPMTRNHVLKKIKCLGDIKPLVIKTNEELMIARETRRLLRKIK